MALQQAAKLYKNDGDNIRSKDGQYGILYEHFDRHGGFTVESLLQCEEWYFVPAELETINDEKVLTAS